LSLFCEKEISRRRRARGQNKRDAFLCIDATSFPIMPRAAATRRVSRAQRAAFPVFGRSLVAVAAAILLFRA
jgi:hypothetical protein